MKSLLFAVVVCSIFHVNAFILDDLFGVSCKTNADCNGGCCHDTGGLFSSSECIKDYLGYLQPCHLSGLEHGTCGCSAGYYCESSDNIQGVALEVHLPPGYGVCEQGGPTNTGNYTTPKVAIESG